MTDRPLERSDAWPPLIVADSKPTWVKVRDVVLTLAMWVLFAIMLETEFELFFGHYLKRLGLGDFDSEANWLKFFNALRPFLLTALVLVALLFVAALLTLRRVARSRRLPPPTPLTIGEQAGGIGMEDPALAAARELRVAVVHIDADGRYRIEPR
jgi:poly-beta-1,6-N-acetyl-D-glucosamine biosynthesis protein PgaD